MELLEEAVYTECCHVKRTMTSLMDAWGALSHEIALNACHLQECELEGSTPCTNLLAVGAQDFCSDLLSVPRDSDLMISREALVVHLLDGAGCDADYVQDYISNLVGDRWQIHVLTWALARAMEVWASDDDATRILGDG